MIYTIKQKLCPVTGHKRQHQNQPRERNLNNEMCLKKTVGKDFTTGRGRGRRKGK